jgi:peroxiredoxin
MFLETVESGLRLETRAQDFSLPDHNLDQYSLGDLIGRCGVLLGFIGDIWQPVSVRRILWLQRQVSKFAMMGTSIAVIVRDYPHILHGFHLSSPLPVPFPLLADADGAVHRAYGVDRYPGLLLIDYNAVLRHKWLMPNDRVWPRVAELAETVQRLQVLTEPASNG